LTPATHLHLGRRREAAERAADPFAAAQGGERLVRFGMEQAGEARRAVERRAHRRLNGVAESTMPF
jgi:hypothetical protein